MPRETLEYYRFRKTYTPEMANSPHFQKILEMDHHYMQQSLPKDCGHLTFSFSYIDNDGNKVYEYFESEDECMAAKAVQFNDHSIYKNYKKEKSEEETLSKFKYNK